MKKLFYLFVLVGMCLSVAYSQAPQLINYQAVARDANGPLNNQQISLQISILQGSNMGLEVYKETHSVMTSNYALFNLYIGGGTLVSGSFSGIDWSSGLYYVKIEMDKTGGTNFQHIGTSQLVSVPYALYAENSGADNDWEIVGNNMHSAVTGNVGIGTDNPANALHVRGSSAPIRFTRGSDENYGGEFNVNNVVESNSGDLMFVPLSSGSGSVFYYRDDGGTLEGGLVLNKVGNVGIGIGTSSPTWKLQVGVAGDGTVACANAWNTPSDARFKKNVIPLDKALDKVMGINGYYYYWIEAQDSSRQVGVIAQEVEAVLPELVSTDEDGYKSVDYSKLSALLIEATKAQQELIDVLQTQNEELKATLITQEDRLRRVQEQVAVLMNFVGK